MSPESTAGATGYVPPLTAFLATGTLLTFVHIKVEPPMLLLERFLPGTDLIVSPVRPRGLFLLGNEADPVKGIAHAGGYVSQVGINPFQKTDV